MRSGVLKVGTQGDGFDGTGPDRSAPLSEGAAPELAGRDAQPSLLEFGQRIGPMDPPLPVVDGPPRFRMTPELVGGFVAIGDVVVLALLVAAWFMAGFKPLPAFAGAAGFVLVAWMSGQYLPRRGAPPWPATLAAVVGGALGAFAAGVVGLLSESLIAWSVAFNSGHGRSAMAWMAASTLIVVAWRLGYERVVEAWIVRGMDRRVAIIGEDQAAAIADALQTQGAAAGLVLAGRHPSGNRDVPAGRLRWPELWKDAAAGRVDAVVVALPWGDGPGGDGYGGDGSGASEACRAVRALPVDVWLAPPAGSPAEQAGQELLPGLRLLAVDRVPLSGWRGVVKRGEDVVLGALLLALFSPVMLVVGILVALDSPGPVLLRQRRFGYGNATFDVFKFRTMFHDKGDKTGARATLPGDRRVTRIGRFLRSSSLDELPQLFNVVRGDMSLVGPRPHPVEMHVDGRMYHLVVPDYPLRHRMKPGITGLAQINGFRGLVDTEAKAFGRIELDLRYIREWTVGMDLRILAQTVFKGFFGSGAF